MKISLIYHSCSCFPFVRQSEFFSNSFFNFSIEFSLSSYFEICRFTAEGVKKFAREVVETQGRR